VLIHLNLQYDAYATVNSNPIPSSQAPAISAQKDMPVAANDKDSANGVISGAPKFEPQGQKILSREEKVEYRDQDGNLLNEEQVKALEGKVEFKTRYETRTRVIDADGNEVLLPEEDQAGAGVAPPHPDVEGANKETKKAPSKDDDIPQVASSSKDGEKEAERLAARPASEGNEATI
jgi:dolichyl-phosphate-mannose-protein mannosyltransferase